jgi:hypothetical protein
LWLGAGLWVEWRCPDNQDKQAKALAALLALLALSAMVFPLFATGVGLESVTVYVAKLPWPVMQEIGAERLLMALSMVLFLGPTANGIVRTCLQVIRNVPVSESEQSLKGGRFIGPLERWLIFGLALAGQPTAAALIISAKSIIRFPELQSKGNESARAGESDNGEGAVSSSGGESGDKEEKPVKAPLIDELTEYFLLGSLLSWGLALLAVLPVIKP